MQSGVKRIGLIGCGKIAQVRHIPELAAHPLAEIAGYYNPTESRARQMAGLYGGKVYDSIDEMLSDPSVDAVVVSLANSAHADVSIRALLAGKDVLCEKPMATTIEECESMVDAAGRSGRLLMIAQNQRLAPAHMKARELILQGAVGKVLTFRTTFGHAGPESWSVNPGKGTWFFSKEKAAMGVMADLGVHKADIISYLLGTRITGVGALLSTLDKTGPDGRPIEVEDNSLCLFRMEDGVIGTMTASWTYYGAEDNSTVIYGTGGILRVYDVPGSPLRLVRPDGSVQDFDVEAIQTNDNQTSSGIAEAFVSSLFTRDGGDLAAERILPVMKAVFAAFRSSSEGRFIEI
jgi:predicted dehydrogenase